MLTQSPDLRAELMAALGIIQAHPPKGSKRKHGDTDDPFANFQHLIACITNNNEGDYDKDDKANKDGEDGEDNEDNKDGSMDTHWIDHWIDKSSSEGGESATSRNKF